MGYRSEVVFAISNELYHKFEEAKKDNKNLQSFLDEADTYHEYTNEEGGKFQLWHWNWIKWNEYGFPGEKAIMDFVKENPDGSRLIIMGEDICDIEDYGTLMESPFDIRIVRAIEYDTP